MQFRTDLAIESAELYNEEIVGTELNAYRSGDITVTTLDVVSQSAAERLGKPVGRYVTAEGLRLSSSFRDLRNHTELISHELKMMLPENGTVLAAGLGNRKITPDAIGPESTGYILATRHIQGEIAKSAGLDGLRSVSVITPGVLGDTGAESAEIISGIVSEIRPAAVIVIDALAARSLSRLGNTVQICNTGISPGSGVGNHRTAINEKTLGVPVISIGVPTVVDAYTLVCDIAQKNGVEDLLCDKQQKRCAQTMMVTPRETDLLTQRAAKLVGMSINCALQKGIDFDTLAALIS